MKDTDDNELVKVQVDLPGHWGPKGETLWAKPLGAGLYEIRNIPWFAYGLAYLDVVGTDPDARGEAPRVVEVVEPSGHETLRVLFSEEVPGPRRVEMMDSLRDLGTGWEQAEERWFALDLLPEALAEEVFDRLDAWEAEGLIEYETCEERVPGSFGPDPDEA